MRLAYLIVSCLPLLGQTSAVSPITKAPGDKVTLEISADSQRGREPLALKWDVVFKAQLIEIDSGATEAGSAALDAGKSIQCSARRQYIYACTLSGGDKTIANGTVAIFHFKIGNMVKPGTTIHLQIQNAESTTADSNKWKLNETEAIVMIK